MESVLLQEFNTKYQSAPFSQICTEEFLPALQKLIAEHKKEIQNIIDNPALPSFQNTLVALERSGKQLDIVSSLFFNLHSAETNDEMEELAMKIGPMLSEHSTWVGMNAELFAKIHFLYQQKEHLSLSKEEDYLLTETHKSFVRSGALLSKTEKKRLEEINQQLSILTLKFGQNVLAATNAYEFHTKDEKLLEGLPKDIIDAYRQEAQQRGKDGYVITLQYPSYLPALTYLKNRELRKGLFLAQGSKNISDNEWNNEDNIQQIIRLRKEKAEILGYESYADFILAERMASSPTQVREFLEKLGSEAKKYIAKDLQELKNLADADGITEMKAYDHAYYAEKLRKQKFDINDEELKPYFPLAQVENAVFGLAEKLFGLQFVKTTDIEVYHPDVSVYEVFQNGNFKALLYTDYFPRKGKRAGAWMTSYQNQYIEDSENKRPHISIVCNFTPASEQLPSLLTFNEVTTLFHEFGHALHGILANTTYASHSGTSVKWDFVELPSQFLENYCYEPEFLQTFAKHYQTGALLPQEKIEKLNTSKNFMEAYQTLRQISFGILDLAYHDASLPENSISEFENQLTEAYRMYPAMESVNQSTSFSHIFQGGYAAGYYSYKWAEVLDADAFAYFKEKGIFDTETAKKFETLLSQGGSEDPMKLYIEFRGQAPDPAYLVKRAFG